MKISPFVRIWRKLNKMVSSYFFSDQWVILTSRNADYRSLNWGQFQKLIPAPDRYWADPFVIERNEQYYVFIEEKIYRTGKGHISCLILDADGTLISGQPVLERPYHLSYPFIFEHNAELYMLPETASNRTVELYRCVSFPDKWQFVKTLMTDIYATDATLFEHEKKWWMFVNVKAEGGSSLDSLNLYFSDSPLSENWRPHPKNPVVNDLKTARPAGKIFLDGTKIVRPSQDNSHRYGYAVNFNEIVKLDEDDYQEITIARFVPPARTSILAAHTWNVSGKFVVADAVVRRKKVK